MTGGNFKPSILVSLHHTIGGVETRIGYAELVDNTITWHFQGPSGEAVLDTVRDDLIKVAYSGGVQIFDLMQPFERKEVT